MATATEVNIDSENTTEFTASVGDLIQICPPVAYPAIEFNSELSDPKQYLLGFIIMRPELGEFEGSDNNCVKYRHKKSGKQIIQFASQGLGEKYFYAIVAGITVHDHASIAQGGPAFATYFTDVPADAVEEGG